MGVGVGRCGFVYVRCRKYGTHCDCGVSVWIGLSVWLSVITICVYSIKYRNSYITLFFSITLINCFILCNIIGKYHYVTYVITQNTI